MLARAIEQLPPDQQIAFLIEGSDPLVEVDAPYLCHALGLVLQHLCHGATAQMRILLEATTCAQIWPGGSVELDRGEPLGARGYTATRANAYAVN